MSRTITLRGDDGEAHRAAVNDDGTVSVDGGDAIATRFGPPGEVYVDGAPVQRAKGSRRQHTAWTAAAGDTRWVFLDGEVFLFEIEGGRRRRRSGAAPGSLWAPMPASVLRVERAPGDAVKRGDTLIILEAMKMELPVRAPADGTVKAVHCKAGDLVQPGTALIEIE